MKNYFKILVTLLIFSYSYAMVRKNNNTDYRSKIAYTKTSVTKKSSESVVRISAIDKDGLEMMTATGFAVKNKKKKTLVITNYHFCIEAVKFDININEISERIPMIYKKESLGRIKLLNQENDLCLIEIDKKIKTAKLTRKYNQFDKIFIIGNPLGIFPIVQDSHISGVVSREDIPFEENRGHGNFIAISLITMPGHSGSPVFNKKGEVIGVIMASMSPGYGGIVIPSETIISFLKDY